MFKLFCVAATALFLVGCAGEFANTAAERGYDALVDQNWATAESELLTALRDDPDDVYSRLNLGVVYAATGRANRAVAQYQAVISNNGNETAQRASVDEDQGADLVELARKNLAKLQN